MSIYAVATTIFIDVDSYARSIDVDSASATKVSKSGDTMTEILAMGSNNITDVADPLSNQDAATKIYVDILASIKLNKVGDTMTGELSMNGNKIPA